MESGHCDWEDSGPGSPPRGREFAPPGPQPALCPSPLFFSNPKVRLLRAFPFEMWHLRGAFKTRGASLGGLKSGRNSDAPRRRGWHEVRKAGFVREIAGEIPEENVSPSCPSPSGTREMLFRVRLSRGCRGDTEGTRAGTGCPRWLGFGTVTRLPVTEPFSSACETSVVTELRPTEKKKLKKLEKRSFYRTWWRGEKKKKEKTIVLKSKYSF